MKKKKKKKTLLKYILLLFLVMLRKDLKTDRGFGCLLKSAWQINYTAIS